MDHGVASEANASHLSSDARSAGAPPGDGAAESERSRQYSGDDSGHESDSIRNGVGQPGTSGQSAKQDARGVDATEAAWETEDERDSRDRDPSSEHLSSESSRDREEESSFDDNRGERSAGDAHSAEQSSEREPLGKEGSDHGTNSQSRPESHEIPPFQASERL